MGRLVISHHKSYHPYRRDNIQRVRDDEETARRKEEDDDARMMLADSEARIALLRKRKDGRGGKHGDDEPETEPELEPGPSMPPPTEPIATTSSRHINLFADLEQQAMRAAITASKKSNSKAAAQSDRGFALAPPEKDLKPWYSSSATGADVEPSHIRGRDKETREDRQNRDLMRKSQSDPLTSINTQLAMHARTQPSSSSSHPRARARASDTQTPRPRIAFDGGGLGGSAVHERLTREASERARAAELIRRRRRELDGSATPSTVHGGMDEPYSDRYNRRETEEAQRRRQRDRRHY
ncbi:hypothetical protein AURDEDRAFT_60920 [Auricularia subglabra TFB-10046 SS5]|nr:hypothetical protein AURDEDRAFT_60920 [Auricularia subglabra TFB-10046 SS5]